ncbi:MAG TPA: invasin domain 3-containing protein [Gemmatimonadales bacterium]|nr:invasin domain 3-containing protein [Gemmatimonadales bacterium]
MRPRQLVPTRRTLTAIRLMAAFAVTLVGITCRDNPVAPRGGGPAAFAIRPYIKQHIDLSSFGLVIDSLRVVVVHPPSDTLKNVATYFNPDSSQVHLDLSVSLTQPSETLSVSVILSAGGVPVFTGTQSAVVSVGSSSSSSPISIPLNYSGPGAHVTALHISPLDSVIRFSDSLRFRVTADSAGTPVTNFYTSWRTSDSLAAKINPFGILKAPAVRKSVYVIVRTPSGAADSTPVTFIPIPTVLAVQSGNNQTGTVGGPLPGPLQVRVTAADGLGVKGIPVQFSILTGGGSIASSPVVTDTGGYASVTPTFGTLAGAVSYQAAVAGLTPVSFSATAKAGLPTQVLVNAGDGQSANAGATLTITPSVVVKDTFANPVPNVGVTFAVVSGGGSVIGGSATTNASGVAAVGSWKLGTVTGANTMSATVGSLSHTFTATAVPGPVNLAQSLVTVSPSDTLASGTLITLTLQAKDSFANNLTTGDATVAFSVTGGTSTGSLSSVTDHGNGTYTATFTGIVAGTATALHATIGGLPVTSTIPALTVKPGALSLAVTTVSVDSTSLASGHVTQVRVLARDGAGNSLGSGGLTVVFSTSGGASTGNFGTVVDSGTGTYTVPFTGLLAGTATTIHVSISGNPVTNTLPLITVVPGAPSAARSTVTVATGTVASGIVDTIRLQAVDAAGNLITTNSATVTFGTSGGTSTGNIGAVTYAGAGVYVAPFTGVLAGTATTVTATVGGTSVTTTLPVIQVLAGVASTATSVVTVDSASLASGHAGALRLTAKDAAGNSLTTGGLTVTFTAAGGTSTGAIGAVTDNGNGTYTATFTAVVAGTATTINAKIGATAVTSSATVQVLPGVASLASSIVTADSSGLASGDSSVLHLQAKDANGNNLTSGGLVVVFSASGGTSTGNISATTDHGNGTYAAVFTSVLAGTKVTIGATIGGSPVTSTLPGITVAAGAASLATSTLNTTSGTIASGSLATLTLQAKDAAGNSLTTGGLAVVFSVAGGTSTGVVSSTTDHGNGSYTATFTGSVAGTATTAHASIGGSAITATVPLTVVPGNAVTAQSIVSVKAGSVTSGAVDSLTLQAKDSVGNNLTTGGLTVVFTATGGTSTGTISGTTDHGNGTYTATFTGLVSGTATTVGATIGGSPVSSTLPTVTVTPGAASLTQSLVTTSLSTLASGATATLKLQAKDANGNNLTAGGLTVAFNQSGGTSTGNIGTVADNGNGTYTASFVGVTAGTPVTIGATIGGSAVTSTTSILVNPGTVSAATSFVTLGSATDTSGKGISVLLQAKDANGNNLTTGGLTVAFTHSGGTSTGSFNAVTDNGNGTYSATFTGLAAGTATSVGATIGGTPITSALPTVTVVPGAVSVATSAVSVSAASIASGLVDSLKLQAKDANGNPLTAGGLTVVFTASGGTSTGTVSATTDHGNGLYTALFTAVLSGTADTIHATIGGTPVTSVLPTLGVTAGAPSPVTSIVSVPVDSLQSGATFTLQLQAKDAAGNSLTTGGATVVFSVAGGTSTDSIGTTVDNANGTYAASMKGVLAGTPDTVKATLNGTPVSSALPTVFVYAGPVSAAKSLISVADSVIAAGGVDTLLLTTKDAAGNLLPKGGLTVVFGISGGTSTGVIGGATDLGNGKYRSIFTGVNAGTAVTVGATIGGTPVTSALPTLRVNTTVHTANILADSTWTTIASPHIVHGYLKIANGATLTIQPGAVVKFDTASGLQVGDTAAAQAGGLSLAGTALQPITLTTDSNGVRPGFWTGVEVQRLLAPTSWTHVLMEGGGGTRLISPAEACLLHVNNTGAALTVDSLHVRDCQGAGINHWGGTLTVRRSEVDTVAGVGIQAINAGTLTLDSTAIRHAGQLGLVIGNPGPNGPFLANAAGNKFIGGSSDAMQIPAFALPHFGPQDSIAGNLADFVVVGGGNPDSTVAAFTLFRLKPAASYAVTGQISIGSATGQTMTLDSNVVVAFLTQAGLVIGDSAGARQGLLKTLSTGRANGAVFTSTTPVTGNWVGLEFGRLSAPDTVVGLNIQYAGDSIAGYTTRRAGIWVRNPTANGLVIQSAGLNNNGSTTSPTNSAGIAVSGSGGGVHIYDAVVLNTAGYGIAYSTPGVRVVADTALSSSLAGLGIFLPPAVFLSPADSVANSRFSSSGAYPAVMGLGAVPALYPAPNAWTGNVRDTVLLTGGTVSGGTFTVPRIPGVAWRTTGSLAVAGGTLTFAKGDTVAFDSATAIFVGDTISGAGTLTAIAPDTAPILFAATPGGGGYWHGITYIGTPGDTSLRNVTVDGAGYFLRCPLIDCAGQNIGAIRVIGTPTANLVFDSITVRNSAFYAIQVQAPSSPGVVVVSHSQFYRNNFPTVFLASLGKTLTIDSSDIYAYRAPAGASVIAASDGSADTIFARNNWWGDVAGPGRVANSLPDSLGRTLIDTLANGIAYAPFATAPYFPVGPQVAAIPVADSNVFCCNISAGMALPDSVRVRAIDANGRGVGGQTVGWAVAPGSGSILGSSPTDIGGRVGAFWTPTPVAKLDTALAQVGSHTASFFVNVFPGPLASEHWQYLPGLTQGVVSSTLDSARFTASGHVGAVLTNAKDAFGNPVLANQLYWDTLPGTGLDHHYSIVTKLAGDTIYFVDTATSQTPFQLHGVYTPPGFPTVVDSVIVSSSFIPLGVRIVPDTAVFNSICPVASPTNAFCSRPITAQLFDSAGGALPPNGQIAFSWAAGGTGFSLDSSGGPSVMTAHVTATVAGAGTLTITQLTGPTLNPNAATATVIAQQVAGQIGPDTVSTGIGDTVTLRALVADSGGTLLATLPAIQWQIPAAYSGLVKLDSAGDSLQVRFDSGLYTSGRFKWLGVVNPFVLRSASDTVIGQGTIFNPLVYNVVGSGISTGFSSRAAVDTATNKTFFTSQGNQLVYVNDNTTNGIVAGITVGFNPMWLTVSHVGALDKVYVSNNTSGTVSVIDPTTDLVSTTISLPNAAAPYGITAADPLGRVYVATRYCPGTPGLCTTEVAIMPIDVAGDSVITSGIVKLNTDSLRFPQGMVYNPVDQQLYVAMDSGYVKVVSTGTSSEVGTIMVQAGFTLSDIAVNPITDTLYVTDVPGQQIGVINPTTAALVNLIPANSPLGIGVDPLHNRIYYASSNNQSIVEIDGKTELFHQVIVGGSSDNPQDAQPDPRTGTVYAPHFSALTVLQFYGKPVGAVLGAPPFGLSAPRTIRLAPMAGPAAKPTARPATRPVTGRKPATPPARPGQHAPANAVDNKKPLQ